MIEVELRSDLEGEHKDQQTANVAEPARKKQRNSYELQGGGKIQLTLRYVESITGHYMNLSILSNPVEVQLPD